MTSQVGREDGTIFQIEIYILNTIRTNLLSVFVNINLHEDSLILVKLLCLLAKRTVPSQSVPEKFRNEL